MRTVDITYTGATRAAIFNQIQLVYENDDNDEGGSGSRLSVSPSFAADYSSEAQQSGGFKKRKLVLEDLSPPPSYPDAAQQVIRIFTDGSCIGNGNKGAKAGIGVHFPDGQLPDIGHPYVGHRLLVCPHTGIIVPPSPSSQQRENTGGRGGSGKSMVTNQRAELEAIFVALEMAATIDGYVPKKTHIHVYTDSKYAINCFTNWIYQWEQNDWKTSNKKPVKNRDIIEPLAAWLMKHRVTFFHARAHTERTDERSLGNAAADTLATKASARQQTKGQQQGPRQMAAAKSRKVFK